MKRIERREPIISKNRYVVVDCDRCYWSMQIIHKNKFDLRLDLEICNRGSIADVVARKL